MVQRRGADARGAPPDPDADAPGLPPGGGDAEPRCAPSRRAASPTSSTCTCGTRSSSRVARGPALRGARLGDRARAALHGGVRDRPARRAAAPSGRRLDEPRGAAARLRGAAHAPGLADGRLVRLLRAHALDRRADAPARRRARRTSSPACTTRSASSSGPTATPEDVLELCERLNPGRIPGRLTLISRMGAERVGELLPPLLARRPRGRAPRRLGVRPDAREHLHDRVRPEDAALRRDHGRDRGLLRRPPAGAHVARRRPPRVHRRRRDRVPRRRGGACSRSSSTRATRRSATLASTRVSRSTSPSAWPS